MLEAFKYSALIISIICFPVGRHPDYPRGIFFFVTNKSHLKPLGKGHRINSKQSLHGSKYEQHNIFYQLPRIA